MDTKPRIFCAWASSLLMTYVPGTIIGGGWAGHLHSLTGAGESSVPENCTRESIATVIPISLGSCSPGRTLSTKNQVYRMQTGHNPIFTTNRRQSDTENNRQTSTHIHAYMRSHTFCLPVYVYEGYSATHRGSPTPALGSQKRS